MLEELTTNSNPPRISVIVATYNDWGPLHGCLQSLAAQTSCPAFEVIVVDDGSDSKAPQSIHEWGNRYTLSIFRQSHAGIPTARNLGMQKSQGEVFVFTDADCRFETTCLSALNSALLEFPQHKFFQLHLISDNSTLVGRSEDLRLTALQKHLLQPDGRIRYLNTAGFAARRICVASQELFDPVALRGEDTLLLVNLTQEGEIPTFLPKATVQHQVRLSLSQCLRKDMKAAWLEAKTFHLIASKGLRTRMGNRERLQMLRLTWGIASQASIGRTAWFFLIVRQAIQRVISAIYRIGRIGSSEKRTAKTSIRTKSLF